VIAENNTIAFAKGATYKGDPSETRYRLLDDKDWGVLKMDEAAQNLLNEQPETNP
jgi:hypothetical protein